jgi:hypothetical protein
MTLDEFQALPTLASGFPLVFASGARWNEFTGYCARCEKPIEPDNLRGNVIPWGLDYRNVTAKVYVVDSLGYCPRCKLLTPFHYRLHEDMSMTGEKDGGWVCWPPPKPSLWARVLKFLKRALGGVTR